MLTLLTCRPEFLPSWASRSRLTQVTLTRLGHPQVEAMITSLTGGKALPAAVVEQIVARTDGVPLFVEELVKMLLESGLVREEGEHYVLTGPLPPHKGRFAEKQCSDFPPYGIVWGVKDPQPKGGKSCFARPVSTNGGQPSCSIWRI
jgi:hypothetical protein